MLIEKPYKDRLIIPLWAEGQSAKLSKIYRNGDVIIPLNQLALEECIELGLDIDWQFCIFAWSKISGHSLNKLADQYLLTRRKSEVKNTRHVSNKKDSLFFEEDENKVLLWRAFREARFVHEVLKAWEGRTKDCNKIAILEPKYVRNTSQKSLLLTLPMHTLKAYANLRGYTVDIVRPDISNSGEYYRKKSSYISTASNDLAIMITYAIPDLEYRISSAAVENKNLLLITTPECSPSLDAIRSIARVHHNVTIAELQAVYRPADTIDITENELIGRQIDEKYTFGLSDFLNSNLLSLNDYGVYLEKTLSGVLERGQIKKIILANHRHPVTHILVEKLSDHLVEAEVFEHSSWPLRRNVFTLDLSKFQKVTRIFYNIDAINEEVRGNRGDHIEYILSPKSTTKMSYFRNLVRQLGRLIRFITGEFSIGIALTSGQAYNAPDVPLSELYTDVANLIKKLLETSRKVKIIVRLREGHDKASVISLYLREYGLDLDRISFSSMSSSPFVVFVKRCNLIYEAGLASSTAYEAIANGVPCARYTFQAEGFEKFGNRKLKLLKIEDINKQVLSIYNLMKISRIQRANLRKVQSARRNII
jgi:hypothetical protein